MFATNFFESQILNTLRNVTLPGYGDLFVGLFLSSPGETGSAGIEVQYNGYTRLPVSFTPPFEESGGMGIRNTNDMLWQSATSDVGQARFIGILDSATVGSGNMLLYGELTIPLDIRSGQQPSIYTGDILYFITGDSSRHFKTRVLNVLRNQSLAGFIPHVALFDGDPELTGVELSGPSYSRVAVTFTPPQEQIGGQMSVVNSNLLRFPSPTTPWGNWAADGLMDASTGGNLIFKAINPMPEVIQRNYVPQVAAGDYEVAVD